MPKNSRLLVRNVRKVSDVCSLLTKCPQCNSSSSTGVSRSIAECNYGKHKGIKALLDQLESIFWGATKTIHEKCASTKIQPHQGKWNHQGLWRSNECNKGWPSKGGYGTKIDCYANPNNELTLPKMEMANKLRKQALQKILEPKKEMDANPKMCIGCHWKARLLSNCKKLAAQSTN